MSYHKFDGRYLAKNGELIAVHQGVGHMVRQVGQEGTIIEAEKVELTSAIQYDHKGDCVNRDMQEQGFYLVERVNPQSLLGQMKIKGCEECTKNGCTS